MHTHKALARWSLFGFMCLLVVVIDLPIITLVLNAFRSTAEILSSANIIPTAGNHVIR